MELYNNEYALIRRNTYYRRSHDRRMEQGHINAAKHIEWQVISEKIFDLTSNFDSEIYLYCRSGNRSGKAKKILDDIGFTNVINAGGKEEASIMIDRIMQNVND